MYATSFQVPRKLYGRMVSLYFHILADHRISKRETTTMYGSVQSILQSSFTEQNPLRRDKNVSHKSRTSISMTPNVDKSNLRFGNVLRILVFVSWTFILADCIRNTRSFETSKPAKTQTDFRSEMKITQIASGLKDPGSQEPVYKNGREVIATSREFDPNPPLLGIELDESEDGEESKEKKSNGPAKEIRDQNPLEAWKYSCIFLHPDCTKGCKRSLNLTSKYVRTSNSGLLAECVQNCSSNCLDYFEESRRRSRGPRSSQPRTR